MTNFNNIKRLLLILILITIVITCATSTNPNLKFSSSSYDPFSYGEYSAGEIESSSRVKRQSRTCPLTPINCNDIPRVNLFRSIDGTCNNLANPYWGAADIPFVRWLSRDKSGDDFRCPSCPRSRDVSLRMNSELPTDKSEPITLMVMQWGQFLDHDLVFTPTDTVENCCQDFETSTSSHPSCRPIDVTGDPFYSSLSTPKNCLRFVRSTAANPDCTDSSNRENINALTAYVDGSMIYGSEESVSLSLRTLSNGLLKIHGSQRETLPCSGPFNACPRDFLPFRTNNNGNQEYFAGDVRVQEQPGLVSLHAVFLRLHNDLATFVNCGGSNHDEDTFQVTRKIVGAIVQQITYNEFLPIVLGPDFMDIYGLTLNSATDSSNTFSNGYDPTVRASAPNVFAAAAYRFGHSLIPNEIHLTSGITVQLSESFNNFDVTLNPNSFPSHFLGGIIGQISMPMDHILVDAVSNKLFASSNNNFEFGSDLYSRNIKRGRDNGIPGYIHWFNACRRGNTPQVTSFNDLYNVMPARVVDAFIQLYNNVEEIDLFPAGIAEFSVNGGLVGPTFACIIAEHFHNLKYGDRFWFERQGVFNLGQIQSIRKTTLGAIVCLFTAVENSQFDVMEEAFDSNPLFPCSDIIQEGVLNDINTSIWSGICP